eukprot:7377838-Prymnesium_polylepis.1
MSGESEIVPMALSGLPRAINIEDSAIRQQRDARCRAHLWFDLSGRTRASSHRPTAGEAAAWPVARAVARPVVQTLARPAARATSSTVARPAARPAARATRPSREANRPAGERSASAARADCAARASTAASASSVRHARALPPPRVASRRIVLATPAGPPPARAPPSR